MKNVDVLILIEHVARELESACLLKYEFERHGYSVVIEGAFPNREMLPLKYRVKILVTPWYYTGTKIVSCFLKYSPDAIIVNLHHEQYSVAKNTSLIPHGDALKVFHTAWGQAYTDQLLEAGCEEEKIIKSGNVRLDFFRKPLSHVYCSKDELSKEFNLDLKKKWILFIADSSHLLESYQLGTNDSGYNHNENRAKAIENRKQFLAYADNYLSKYKDVIFIYRPHPAYANKDLEQSDLKELCKKYPENFVVLFKYALNTWLAHSDMCMSFISSSLVECYLASTPYYLFRVKLLPKENDYKFFYDFEYTIGDYDSFTNAINHNSEYDFALIKHRIEDYYYLDGEPSYKKIVNKIMQIKGNKNDIYFPKSRWYSNVFEAYTKQIIILFSKIKIVNNLLARIGDNRLNRIIGRNEDVVTESAINEIVVKISNVLKAL